MIWIAKVFVVASTLQLVVSDGYTKENPHHSSLSDNTGGSHGSPKYSSHSSAVSHGYYGGPVSMDYVSRYHGPIAVPVVLPDGRIADTPEVSAARAAHLAALEKAKALWYGKTDYGSHSSNHKQSGSVGGPWAGNTQYHGPLAMVTVLPSGYLADTPAIASARASHLNALLKAQADAAAWKAKDWEKWQ